MELLLSLLALMLDLLFYFVGVYLGLMVGIEVVCDVHDIQRPSSFKEVCELIKQSLKKEK